MGTHKHTTSVSMLITVHNREKYVAAAIESALVQTFTGFELLIVDDASTDGSFEMARRYETDSRVKVFRNESNLGQFPNRARAVELARGLLLKFVDSDDLLYRHSLAIMVEAMEAHPDAALALSHSSPEDEGPYPWKLSPAEAWRKQFLGHGCLSCGPSSAILRREAFIEVGGFGPWGVLNDTDLWYRMAARWPVVLLPPGLVWWRRHDQQEFTKDNAAMTYLERGFALTLATLSSAECPLDESERQAAFTRARQHHARRLFSLGLRRRQPVQAWRLFRKSGIGLRGLLRGFQRYQ
jgi:glycosyltransferase involved in cell wall biosynthesis